MKLVLYLHVYAVCVSAKIKFFKDLRDVLSEVCFSLCIVTVKVIIYFSFCNLQFLESLL
jgi:hypothetical protein